MQWEAFKVRVPEGSSGDWLVERFTVSQEDAEFSRMRAAFSFSMRGRSVPAGEYTALKRNGSIIMSDTRDEIRDHYEPIRRASGSCLVNGLGLGMVSAGMLRKDEVDHVTIVELSEDVIRLVGPTLTESFGDKVTIIQGDALEWAPPRNTRYQVVWHDIWDSICADNLPSMKRLHRRFGRRSDWQGSWCRARCEW